MTGPGADFSVVTGAFGYSGKYITKRLLAAGLRVRTLTNSPQRANPFGDAVQAHPCNFDDPDELVRSLEGARVLVNTYWVRFDHADFTHAQAVRNTRRLFDAARRAGVPRVVHVSITNPSAQSPLPYFRGKAELEAALVASGLPYAILRPTVDDLARLAVEWAESSEDAEHREGLGRRYSSELARRRDRRKSYEDLRKHA